MRHTDTEGGARALCTAFQGTRRIASGELREVVLAVKQAVEADPWEAVLVFEDSTSRQIELDLRGTEEEVLQRLEQQDAEKHTTPSTTPEGQQEEGHSGPGRPKLGVVAREVTLLPRHWEWLNQQSGGASVALRKLVEEARRTAAAKDHVRQAQEVAYRFLSVMAGNMPDFEEATRALFEADQARFNTLTEAWPTDIRDHARKLAVSVFPGDEE